MRSHARERATSGYDYPLLQSWLKAGYAVVRTDYEGLGTPGVHPYLIGARRAAACSTWSARRAQLDPSIGKKIVISGHSQGGHAALWAASLAAEVDAGAELKGTVAFAPA